MVANWCLWFSLRWHARLPFRVRFTSPHRRQCRCSTAHPTSTVDSIRGKCAGLYSRAYKWGRFAGTSRLLIPSPPRMPRSARKTFLADSLPATFVKRDRVKTKREHYILKYEFWIGLNAHAVTRPDPAIRLARMRSSNRSSALKPPLCSSRNVRT